MVRLGGGVLSPEKPRNAGGLEGERWRPHSRTHPPPCLPALQLSDSRERIRFHGQGGAEIFVPNRHRL